MKRGLKARACLIIRNLSALRKRPPPVQGLHDLRDQALFTSIASRSGRLDNGNIRASFKSERFSKEVHHDQDRKKMQRGPG